jgi:nitrite reductase (NADH) small subunit
MTSPWTKVCPTSALLPFSGVAALVAGRQIAIFRAQSDYFALSNYDPFSGAYVLARGLVGDRAGVLKVASPIYKQSFALQTGECLDDPKVKLPTYPVRVEDNTLYVAVPA